MRDTPAGSTLRLSRGATGGGDGASRNAAISADGACVAFESEATNLVADDGNGNQPDILLYERATATLTRISRRPDGSTAQPGDTFVTPTVSADCRYIVYLAVVENIVPPGAVEPDAQTLVQRYDRRTGETRVLSMTPDGRWMSDKMQVAPAISSNGQVVALRSALPYLPDVDVNAYIDVYTLTDDAVFASGFE